MIKIILSCEHGGNIVPESMSAAFAGAEDVLETHRALDIGALPLFRKIANREEVDFSTYETITRLLIEINRGLYSDNLFSDYAMRLVGDQRLFLLDEVYKPYRADIENEISSFIESGHHVLHLGVHSFTPIWEGKERSVDIGLLFDPARQNELEFCERWKSELKRAFPEFEIRFNEPYLGTDDGLTTDLRSTFSGNCYAGIELEVNQKFVNEPYWEDMMEKISETFFSAIREA